MGRNSTNALGDEVDMRPLPTSIRQQLHLPTWSERPWVDILSSRLFIVCGGVQGLEALITSPCEYRNATERGKRLRRAEVPRPHLGDLPVLFC